VARLGRAQRRASPREPLPPPLPPEKRTIGQLVAETVQFYRHRFFQTLPLGLSVAVLTQTVVWFNRGTRVTELDVEGLDPSDRLLFARALNARRIEETDTSFGSVLTTMLLGGVLLTASYIGATMLVSGVKLDARRGSSAFIAGVLAFVPVPLLATLFYLPAVAWLAFVGLVVPVALIEGTGVKESFSRATRLARADFVHALGGLATLVIVFVLTRIVLLLLLRNAGEATERIAAFLADLVLSPLLFVGSVYLYYDQKARLALRSGNPPTRRPDADLRDADEADDTRRPDASVEPRPAS
jgi:hypothetical protein